MSLYVKGVPNMSLYVKGVPNMSLYVTILTKLNNTDNTIILIILSIQDNTINTRRILTKL